MTPEVTTPLPYARPTFKDNPRVVVVDWHQELHRHKLEQAGAGDRGAGADSAA